MLWLSDKGYPLFTQMKIHLLFAPTDPNELAPASKGQ